MTDHKKYGNNKAQQHFKVVQQLASKKVAKINMEKFKVSRLKGLAEVRKLLGEPVLDSLNELI